MVMVKTVCLLIIDVMKRNLLSYRLVVVAEYTLAYETFPIPLLNRFEKHFIATSTVLTKRQARITNNLNVWAKIFVQRERSTVSLPRQKKAG